MLKYKDKTLYLEVRKHFYGRLRGFMLTKKIDRCLLFNNCNSIHTFFMLRDIDVIMCDKFNVVKYYYRNLSKNKIIWPKRGVNKVYETPGGYYDIKIGDKLEVIE